MLEFEIEIDDNKHWCQTTLFCVCKKSKQNWC